MEQNQSIPNQWSSNDLFNVAKWQKYIILLVLLQLVTAAGFVMMSMMSSGVQQGAPVNAVFGVITIIYLIFRFVVAGLSIYGIIMLTTALRKPTGTLVLYIILIVIGMFLPLIGLIVLLMLNSQATNLLRSNNVNVGFMGVEKADLERLRTSI
ncbi:MAG: hypothetical protein ACYC0V_15290 [Armatimonadota bacterium]